MRPSRAISAVTCVALLLATTAWAEQPTEDVTPYDSDSLVRVGARVRVRATVGGKRQTTIGQVLRADEDGLLLRVGGRATPLELLQADIERVDVSAGRRTKSKEGAYVGGVLGAAASLALTVLLAGLYEPRPGDCRPCELVLGVALFTAVGAGVGALFGNLASTDDWRVVESRPRRWSLRVFPTRSGAGAAVTLRF